MLQIQSIMRRNLSTSCHTQLLWFDRLFRVEVEFAGDQVRETVRRGRAGHRVELDKCAVGCEGLVKLKFGSGDVVEAECA